MDPAYFAWIAIAVVGAILGVFLRPRTIALISAVLFAFAVVGIAVAYGAGKESLGFLFGVAAVAIPIIGGMLAFGAAIVRSIFSGGPKC